MHSPQIAVFCASSTRVDARFRAVAEQMGQLLAENNCTLVYGGGDVGLMGILARAVHSGGGRVVGIIPHALQSIEGVAYNVSDELIITDTMRERKALIYERADAFVALPGGYGTLEEFLEVVTLKKLGYHDHPVALISPDGFYDRLLEFFGDLERDGFLRTESSPLFETAQKPGQLFELDSFKSVFSAS